MYTGISNNNLYFIQLRIFLYGFGFFLIVRLSSISGRKIVTNSQSTQIITKQNFFKIMSIFHIAH